MSKTKDFVPGTKIPKPHVKLVGQDGNAYFIMGRISEALRRAGCNQDIINEYTQKSTSGDYNNLLRVAMEYINEAGEEDGDDD